MRNAREALSVANKMWGRCPSTMERLMLDIGEADLEGTLVGGSLDVVEKMYRKVLTTLTEDAVLLMAESDRIKEILQVHCLIGLARISLSRDRDNDLTEKLARTALTTVLPESSDHSGRSHDMPTLLCIYTWKLVTLRQLSHSYHICSARQLVAEACIQSRPDDACSFLTQAVSGTFKLHQFM